MRKLIVSNFVTLDGYYESEDKTFDRFFAYQHPDYAGDDQFDYYNTERLRATLCRHRGPPADRFKLLRHNNFRRFGAPMHLPR